MQKIFIIVFNWFIILLRQDYIKWAAPFAWRTWKLSYKPEKTGNSLHHLIMAYLDYMYCIPVMIIKIWVLQISCSPSDLNGGPMFIFTYVKQSILFSENNVVKPQFYFGICDYVKLIWTPTSYETMSEQPTTPYLIFSQ